MKKKLIFGGVLVCATIGVGGFFLKQPAPDEWVQPPAAPKISAVDLTTLKAQADSGDPAAQTKLGRIYLEGTAVKPDPREAVKWFQLAAGKNYPDAQAALGELTQAGQGVPLNLTEAVRLYRLAAENGSVAGQYDLAFIYEQGAGVKKDQAAATEWYQRAAEGGDPLAQYDIGQRYQLGIGVSIDRVQAFKWLTIAAAQGQSDSAKLLLDLKREMSGEEMAEADKQVKVFVPRSFK